MRPNRCDEAETSGKSLKERGVVLIGWYGFAGECGGLHVEMYGAARERDGERTRHRVLFPAPSPETSRNHLGRWNFMGVLRAKGCRTAGARFGARGGACAPLSERFALPFGFMMRIHPPKNRTQ